jgi:hypothetical protein
VIGRASDPATIRPSLENPSKNHDLVVPPPTPHVESAAGGALTPPSPSGGVGRHWREADNLSATYLIRANPLLTYAQKPRTETEEKAYSSERAKEAVR